MSDVDRLPAFDRVQSAARSTPPSRSPALLRVVVGLLALAVAAYTAWQWWPSDTDAGDVLVQLTVAADFRPELATTEPEAAHAFVLETLGWSVGPPDLPGLALVGVGLPSIGTVRATPAATPVDVQVPGFRYGGPGGAGATVFAYDYILLDRVGGSYDLPEGTYAGLSEPTPVDSRVVDGTYVVTWRERAMIFSAVTADEDIADQIRRAVASEEPAD